MTNSKKTDADIVYERIRDIYEILNKLNIYKKDPKDIDFAHSYDEITNLLRSAILLEHKIIDEKIKD